MRAFVQQGGSDDGLDILDDLDDDAIMRSEGDAALDNTICAEDGTRYLRGFYRIGKTPDKIGSDSHFEQIIYPERYAADSSDDIIVSPNLPHGIPDDNYEIPDYVAFVHTQGKKTRLSHLFRGDERGMILNALRRMRVVTDE